MIENPLHILLKALSAIGFLLLIWKLVRLVNSAANDLEWADLISTPRPGGRSYVDWDKIGKGLGVVLCVWLPSVYAYSPSMNGRELAELMLVALGYLGAVSAYSATLRARAGGVVTTRVSEDASRVTDTTEKTAPIDRDEH